VDNQTLLIGSITPSLTFDTRDSPFTASRGQITTLTYEYAQPALANRAPEANSAVGYYKWTAATHFYVPLPLGIVWSNVVSGGHARSLISNQIPLIKTFRLGGYASIRGFTEDSINRDKFAIFGSLSFINLRTQFDVPLVGELKFAPFVDAGNLFVDVLRAAPFLRVGAGAGLHYLTPIGPINFDYGVKLNRRTDEKTGQFHFSVGII
jgi:outer membrane protein insertion porin family